MNTDWEAFEQNARAILSDHAPEHWRLTQLEASEHRVFVRFEWGGNNTFNIDYNKQSSADAALASIVRLLDAAREQGFGE